MEYRRTVTLKDGRECTLRNGTESDAQTALDNFILTHTQTDYLMSYPDECTITAEQEGEFLRGKTESANEIEILAEIGGMIVGTAGIESRGDKFKLKHRAEFGISIDREYWGLGIGRALTEACIECAKKAGYAQLELGVVADNDIAVSLYRSTGFIEYGRNPKGFRSRNSGWQELMLMRLDLE